MIRRWISSLLFLMAGVAIGIWVWSQAREAIDQKHDEQAFERERADASREAGPHSRSDGKRPGPAPGEVVGRLVIHRIGLKAMVREGDDANTLDVALGHIPGTALPGQKGNVGLAGHRDSMFSHLAEVGRNDEIQLQTPSATYTYKVDEMSIVKPDTVSVLAPGRGQELTLVTCYPFRYIGSAPERYIVKAHLVTQKPVL
jgi:sortase A